MVYLLRMQLVLSIFVLMQTDNSTARTCITYTPVTHLLKNQTQIYQSNGDLLYVSGLSSFTSGLKCDQTAEHEHMKSHLTMLCSFSSFVFFKITTPHFTFNTYFELNLSWTQSFFIPSPSLVFILSSSKIGVICSNPVQWSKLMSQTGVPGAQSGSFYLILLPLTPRIWNNPFLSDFLSHLQYVHQCSSIVGLPLLLWKAHDCRFLPLKRALLMFLKLSSHLSFWGKCLHSGKC